MIKKKLSQKKSHRELTLRNLATSLILYEKIQTTKAKARAVKATVEKIIGKAKKGDLSARRELFSFFLDKMAVAKVFEKLIPRYKNISSGFVKIYKLFPRKGDNAPMAMLRLIPQEEDYSKLEDKKDGEEER